MTEIAIYQDEGCGSFCSARLISELLRFTAPMGWRLRAINAAEIRDHTGWGLGLRLLVFPGGMDRFYMRQLGEKGRMAIYKYVASGGGYLGICAGAYFAAKRIIYQGAEDKKPWQGDNRLGLFKGLASGPVPSLPAAMNEGYEGTSLPDIIIEHKKGDNLKKVTPSFYLGGAFFVPDAGTSDEIEVIARYKNIDDQPIAALRAPVGLGVAVLCGTHPEITGPAFSDMLTDENITDPALHAIAEKLTEKDPQRKEFFNRLLRAADIE